MKTAMHLIFLSISLLLIISCNSEKKKAIWPPPKDSSRSCEIINGDTFNRLIYGYRQGKWYIIDSAIMRSKGHQNAIKDTVFYRNDTIIEK